MQRLSRGPYRWNGCLLFRRARWRALCRARKPTLGRGDVLSSLISSDSMCLLRCSPGGSAQPSTIVRASGREGDRIPLPELTLSPGRPTGPDQTIWTLSEALRVVEIVLLDCVAIEIICRGHCCEQ